MAGKNEKIGKIQAGFREKRVEKTHIFKLKSLISNRLKEKGRGGTIRIFYSLQNSLRLD